MKKNPCSLVVRLAHSAYFSEDFLSQEAAHIRQVAEGLRYAATAEEALKVLTPRDGVILLTNSDLDVATIPASLLAQTRLLIHPNSGYDNLTLAFVQQASFPILIGHTIRAGAVAEYILQAIWQSLAAPRPEQKQWDPKRQWPRTLLADRHFLLVGAGAIGQRVQNSLLGVGVPPQHLQICDPFRSPYGPRILSDFALEEIDCLVLCCGLNVSSFHLLNRASLNRLRPQVVLINAARGKLIPTEELSAFAERSPQAQIYLDVYEQEPAELGRFSEFPNIHTTSHIAGVDRHLESRMIEFTTQVIRQVVHHDPDLKALQKNSADLLLQNRIHHHPLTQEAFLL